MAAKTSWHRYGTKLRHCHHMYKLHYFACLLMLQTVDFVFVSVCQATGCGKRVSCCSELDITKARRSDVYIVLGFRVWSVYTMLRLITARCYASAVYTSHGPVSVRPSQVGVLLRRLNESSWFLACELPSTRSTLCKKEILLSPKIRALPSGTLS